MNTSITFIMSFVASVSMFSPVAVAKHVDFPQGAEAGKHCELQNLPDHRLYKQVREVPTQPANKARKAQS